MVFRVPAVIFLACTIAAVFLPPAAADEPLFSLMEKGFVNKDRGSDYALCQRTAYGKSFDRWVDAYTQGRKADALVEWGHVLKETRGARSLYELTGLVSTRMQFLEGKQSRALEKSGGVMAALKTILEETQNHIGNRFWTATIADYICDRYTKAGNWKEAIVFAKRSVVINEHEKPRLEQEYFHSLIKLAKLQCCSKEFSAARENTEAALAVATKSHAADGISIARTLLSQIKTRAALPPKP